MGKQMAERIKCLDTYALMGIALQNAHFLQYLEEDIIITDLTLAEFYGVLLKKHNEQTAEYWYRQMSSWSQPVPKEILIKAAKFKHEYRKTNISFFDAVGYVFSRQNNHAFVTGDKEFQNMPGVEFRQITN